MSETMPRTKLCEGMEKVFRVLLPFTHEERERIVKAALILMPRQEDKTDD